MMATTKLDDDYDDDTDANIMLHYDGNVIIISLFIRQFIHFLHFHLHYCCLQWGVACHLAPQALQIL